MNDRPSRENPSPDDDLRALWRIWRQSPEGSPRPDVWDFIASLGPLSPSQILSIVIVDQRERWSIGERPRLEEYLERCPALDHDEAAQLLFRCEWGYRRRRRESFSVEEYQERFPKRHGDLALHWHVFEELGTRDPLSSSSGAMPIDADELAEQFELGTRFRLIRKLDEGGMGVIWEARDTQLDRRVAIKIPKFLSDGGHPAWASACASEGASDEAARDGSFINEAFLIARLEHPSIVPIYEVGALDDGRPFFAMKLVVGQPLEAWLTDHAGEAPDASEFLTIFEKICQSVALAHSQDPPLLHRDLKPANVMIGEYGTVFLMDWGLAKRQSNTPGHSEPHAPAAGATAGATAAGAESDLESTPKGTLSYIAPEILLGRPAERTADVFGLGGILYRRLTGEPPHGNSPDVLELITAAKSTDAASLRQGLQQRLRRLCHPGADPGLVEICVRCLDSNPAARYHDAGAVAQAIAVHQANLRERFEKERQELVRAQDEVQHTRRRRRWQRALLATLSLLALVATAAALSLSVLYRQSESYRQLAELHEAQALKGEARAVESEALAKSRQAEAERQAYQMRLAAVHRAMEDRRFQDAFHLIGRIDLPDTPWEMKWLWNETQVKPFASAQLSEHGHGVLAALLSEDGRTLVTTGADGQVLKWDATAENDAVKATWAVGRKTKAGNAFVFHLVGDAMEQCYGSLAWVDSEKFVAAAGLTGQAILWDRSSGRSRPLFHAGEPLTVVASARQQILFGTSSGKILVWEQGETKNKRWDVDLAGGAVTAIEWLPGAGIWLAGTDAGQLFLIDGTTRAVVEATRVPGPVWSIAARLAEDAAKGNDLVAIGCQESAPRLFRSKRGVALDTLDRLAGTIKEDPPKALHRVRWSRDGRQLFALDDRGNLIGWERGDGTLLWVVPAITKNSKVNAFRSRLPTICQPLGTFLDEFPGSAPNAGELLTAGEDMVVKRWILPQKTTAKSIRTGADPRVAIDAADATRLWILDRTGAIQLVDMTTATTLAAAHAHRGGTSIVASALAAGGAITCGPDGDLVFWEFVGGALKAARRLRTVPLRGLAVSHDQKWLAGLDLDGELSVWNAAGKDDELRQPVYRYRFPDGPTHPFLPACLAFNADDTLLAVLGPAQRCDLFGAARGARPWSRYFVHGDVAGETGSALRWHPSDPGTFALADSAGRFKFITLANAKSPPPLLKGPNPASPAVGIGWSSDGTRLFLLEEKGAWSVRDTGQLGLVLARQLPFASAGDFAIDPAGRRLVFADRSGAVHLRSLGDAMPKVAALPQVSARWTSSEFTLPNSHQARMPDDHGLILTADDRVAMVWIEPGLDEQKLGKLWFAEEHEGQWASQVLLEKAPLSTRGYRLQPDPSGHLALPYRLRKPAEGPYVATLNVLRRNPDGSWYEEWNPKDAPPLENHYFDPLLLWRKDRPLGVIHFGSDVFQLYCTQTINPTDNEAAARQWKCSPIHRQGDGFNFCWQAGDGGALHLFYNTNRMNEDQGPPVYARLDGQQWRRRQLPGVLSGRGGLALLPNQEAVFTAKRLAPKEMERWSLVRSEGDRWRREDIPGAPPRSHSIVVNKNGSIYVPSFDPHESVLSTLELNFGSWQQHIMGTCADCQWASMFLNRHDKLVAVAGSVVNGQKMVQVYRQK